MDAIIKPWPLGTPDPGVILKRMRDALRFTREAQPDLFSAQRYPKLHAHSERCEAMPEFARHSLPVTITFARSG